MKPAIVGFQQFAQVRLGTVGTYHVAPIGFTGERRLLLEPIGARNPARPYRGGETDLRYHFTPHSFDSIGKCLLTEQGGQATRDLT